MKANAETVKGRSGRTDEFQHGSSNLQCTVHQVTISGRKGKSPETCSEIRKILIPVLPTPPSYSAIPAGCPQLNSDTAYLGTVPQDCAPLPTTSDTMASAGCHLCFRPTGDNWDSWDPLLGFIYSLKQLWELRSTGTYEVTGLL